MENTENSSGLGDHGASEWSYIEVTEKWNYHRLLSHIFNSSFRDFLQLPRFNLPFILSTSLCAYHIYEKALNKIPQSSLVTGFILILSFKSSRLAETWDSTAIALVLKMSHMFTWAETIRKVSLRLSLYLYMLAFVFVAMLLLQRLSDGTLGKPLLQFLHPPPGMNSVQPIVKHGTNLKCTILVYRTLW